jgi:hypothetical protein
MAGTKTKKSTPREIAGAVLEHSATATAALGGTALAGPLGALTAGSAMKGFIAAIKHVVSKRAEKRIEEYTRELGAALTPDGVAGLAAFEAGEHFGEVVFQTYRKAMDALCPAVVPSLARLAAHFSGCPLDGLFRGLGRTLQDIEDEQLFNALRVIVSCVVKAAENRGERVEIEANETNRDGADPHLFIIVDNGRTYFDGAGAVRADRGMYRRRADISEIPRFDSVLMLLERHGLCHGNWGRTRENAPAASFILEVALCRRAQEIVGPLPVELLTEERQPSAASETPSVP